MPSPDAHSKRPHPRVGVPTHKPVEVDHGIIRRRRRRNAERRLARLLAPRNRHALAKRLRRTANDPAGRSSARRILDASVQGRATAVRTELLEIADLLENAHDPDPASIKEIGQLLARRDSPLYHPAIHISELHAALYYIRAGLITPASGRRPTDMATRADTESPVNRTLPGNRERTAINDEDRPTAIPEVCTEHVGVPADLQTIATRRRRKVLQRLHSRREERKHARPVSAGQRRILARWLRRTATQATDRDPIRRRRDVLLHYRAAAVRTDLLEIAALLEHAHNPDADCVAALRNLLANGCDSPLYNTDIHFSELRATLDYVRSGL